MSILQAFTIPFHKKIQRCNFKKSVLTFAKEVWNCQAFWKILFTDLHLFFDTSKMRIFNATKRTLRFNFAFFKVYLLRNKKIIYLTSIFNLTSNSFNGCLCALKLQKLLIQSVVWDFQIESVVFWSDIKKNIPSMAYWNTAWDMSKYGPEIIPYLETFRAVKMSFFLYFK